LSILNVDNISFGYDDKTILKNISFRLLKGEHAGLVGDNGTGKTTLFNILTGELIADEGNLQWSSNLKIGYLEQHIMLSEEESILNNLRDAFKELYTVEARINSISNKLSGMETSDMNKALKELGNLQDRLMLSGFYNIDSVIRTVSTGIGLDALGLDIKASKLSGGQRTKVSLAKLLLEKPDLLLLDEPTNYLDEEHVDWLSNYLNNYPKSFIVISHDTEFLNCITNVILHLEFCNLKRYPGNYDNYVRLSKLEREKYINDYNRQQKEIHKMESFIEANIVRATTTKRAQSRRKQLSKIERIEKPQTSPKPSFSFLTCRQPGKLIFKSSQLDIGYNYPIIKGLTLELFRGQKIAITGCNGIGKSTMLKTLLGVIPKLGGNIQYGEFLKPVYFEQETKYTEDITAMEEVWHDFPHKTQREIREALAKCGLKQEQIMHSMNQLSGGEQSKVRLCKLTLTPSNWLILDEPTNHLDLESKEVLKKALDKFQGTVVAVSHEKEFYEDWVTGIWNMEKYI
jgi:ATPase subunit of ABC transporter with duplicated ATPase domains